MAKIADLLTKNKGRGINHFRFGYEESPMAALGFYNLADLNNPKFDFSTAKMKRAKSKVDGFSDTNKFVWYEDSIREFDFLTTSAAAAWVLTYTMANSNIVVGDKLYVTNAAGDTEVQIVTAVSGANVTVDQNTIGFASGARVVRLGHAKTYGVYSGKAASANDYVTYDNYVEFAFSILPKAKTDILTNNLDHLMYDNIDDYLQQEIFAPASRDIVRSMVTSLYAGRKDANTVSGNTIYTAGGLENFIPWSALNVNIKGTDDKETIQNLRNQLAKVYGSGVDGIYNKGRVMAFCNFAMSSQIDDLFFDKIDHLPNYLDKFGINVKRLDLNGRPLDIVEDSILTHIYGDQKVMFIVDIDNVVIKNLMNDVIGKDGKTAPKLGTSVIWEKPQDTPEMREIGLFTNFSFEFHGVSAGTFRKIIYA